MSREREQRIVLANDEPKRGFVNVYRVLTAVIALGIAVIGALAIADARQDESLPPEIRFLATDLSNLPVSISDVVSCSCWHGPRNQAQRKYKFHIVNNSNVMLRIGGDETSQIRLIVAYPTEQSPPLTFPKAGSGDETAQFVSPRRTDAIGHLKKQVMPSRILGQNNLLGVPASYTVWALPPTPNKLAEQVSRDGDEVNGSYPTVVDKTNLLPGEGYKDLRLGHGNSTFYIPIKKELADVFIDSPFQVVQSDAEFEDEVIFVGVAAFEHEEGGW